MSKKPSLNFHPNCKSIVTSSPIVRTDKKEPNNMLKKYNNSLKQEERKVIFDNTISASHLHRDGLHLNWNGTIILAGTLLSRIRTFWHNEDSNKETNLSNDRNGNNIIDSSNYKSLINDDSAIQLGNVKSVLKRLCSGHPQQIIIGHLNNNSIRKKIDIMKPMLLDDIDIFMVTEAKLDDSLPASQFNVEGFSTPFKLDRNKNGRGIILYIRSYIIASEVTSFTFPNDIKAFFIEMNLLKLNSWWKD